MKSRLLLWLVGAGLLAAPTPTMAESKDWDWVFVYVMSYDNNLEGCGPIILDGLYEGLQSERMAVTVLADFTDTDGLQRHTMRAGERDHEVLQSDNSASEEVLAEYLAWVAESHPAAHYALVFLDHGGDLDQMCLDEQPGDGSDKLWLSAEKVGPVLRDFREDCGGEVDLLFLQQCGRGSVDNLYNFQGTAEYVMASQTTVGAPNTYYSPTLRWLADNRDSDGQAIAERIMTDDQHYTNYVSVRGDALAELPERLDGLVEELVQVEDLQVSDKLKPCFGGWGYGSETNFDLLGWFGALYTDNQLETEGLEAFSSWVQEELVVTHRVQRRAERAARGWCGLALYVPQSPKVRGKYPEYPLNQDCRIDELMDRLYPAARR